MPKVKIHNSQLPQVIDKKWDVEQAYDVNQAPTVEVEDEEGNLVGVEVTDYGFLITVVKNEQVHTITEVVTR